LAHKGNVVGTCGRRLVVCSTKNNSATTRCLRKYQVGRRFYLVGPKRCKATYVVNSQPPCLPSGCALIT
jgi:hypothetical protein